MEHTQASAALIAQAQERIRGTFIELIGLRLIEVTSERAVAEMPFAPQLQQLTGVLHAGALLTLAEDRFFWYHRYHFLLLDGRGMAMVTRRVDVFDPAVVTVAHIEAGSTNNVIPDTAFLEGTIRTLSAGRRADVVAGVERVATHVAAAHEMTVDFQSSSSWEMPSTSLPVATSFSAIIDTGDGLPGSSPSV